MAFVIPNRPIGANTRDISAIIADFDAMAADYETGFSGYKDIITIKSAIASGTGVSTVVLADSSNAGGTPASVFTSMFWLDPADYTAATPRVVKARVRAVIAVGTSAPAATFTAGLYPVTTVGGAAAPIVITAIGAVVASSTAVIATPGASSVSRADSVDFVMPASGAYILGCAITGGALAGAVAMSAKLQMHQT